MRRAPWVASLLGIAFILLATYVARSQTRKGLSEGRPPMQIPTGNRDIVTEVSGGYEAQYFFRRLEKPPDWEQNLEIICELKKKSVEQAIDRLETNLADLKTQEMEQSYYDAAVRRHHTVGQLYAFQGNTEKALGHFQTALQIAIDHGLAEFALDLEERIGITQMRRGEVDNCIANHNAKSCIFPISKEGQHAQPAGSQAAIQQFLAYLKQKPQDLEVRWLLNIAYMTLGKYPAEVPPDFLIPPSTFESKENIGFFEEVASFCGLNVFGQAGGAVMDDFDRDGFLDIVVTSLNPCDGMNFFHNNGDGTFTDSTGPAGLSKQFGGLSLNHTDYNNDGWLDLLVVRGGWDVPTRKSLLKNNGDGTFSDVTEKAGFARPATATQAAAWADYDNDGWIDVFVGNENAPCQLFHNKGDGTFEEVAHQAGVDQVRFTKGVTAEDYDNDGFPDFYVSNGGDENFLYHNNHDGTFTDVARKLGVEKPLLSFAAWFFDYDNDGWPDLFVTSFLQSVTQVAKSYLKLPVEAETLRLYKNLGKDGFRDVTHEVGLDRVFMPMGCNFGDVDNDGFLDFYLGTGAPSYAALVPNVLFRNHEGQYFVDITTSSGTGHLQKGHGVAIGDLNNDGDEDIFIKIGGAVPGDRYASALFKNPGHPENHWLKVQLEGVKTNRAAIGARLTVTVVEGNRRRQICRTVNAGGSFGDSPFQQHIGLGKSSQAESLEVWWPTSKTRMVFHDLQADQLLKIKEFEQTYTVSKPRSFAFAGAPGKGMDHTKHRHNP
ncbi:MAG: CRTAC1 family protein [Terriglobia bacterium]